MYSSLVRLQNTFGFFTSVCFFVAALIATTDFLAPRTPSGVLRSADIKVVTGRPHYYSTRKEEYSQIKFNLEADLSSLFTWNTKQVFVYVTAEWPEVASKTANATNQAVIWDSIITAPSSDHLANITPAKLKRLRKQSKGKPVDPSRGVLKLKNESPKYKITHPSGKMASAENVVLRLHYNVQPWVGVLTWNQDRDIGLWKSMKGGASKAFKLPAIKKKV